MHNNTFLRNCHKKLNQNNYIDIDRREKHAKQNKIHPELLEGVKNHISSIPKIESHYLKAKSNTDYIDGSLNIFALYKLYKK